MGEWMESQHRELDRMTLERMEFGKRVSRTIGLDRLELQAS